MQVQIIQKMNSNPCLLTGILEIWKNLELLTNLMDTI